MTAAGGDDVAQSESDSANQVRMAVDDQICIAAGQCEMLEPEVFVVDDETVVAIVTGGGTLDRDRAATLVDCCPTGAISIAG